MEMNAQVTKIQTAENDLKELMAGVTRAIEKAQQAVAGRLLPHPLLARRDRMDVCREAYSWRARRRE
jgi:hypothetical protein